jgi:hypothetical protein
MVGIVPLAALGLDRIVASVQRRAGAGFSSLVAATCVVVAAAAFSVAELAPVPFPVAGVGTAPDAYAAVRRDSGVVVEYPAYGSDRLDSAEYLLRQTVHRRPLLNGAGRGTPAEAMRAMLVDPAARGVASSLALLGVTTIVTRPTTYAWQSRIVPFSEPDVYGAGYELASGRSGGLRVWRVTADPAPAFAVYRDGSVAEPIPGSSPGHLRYPVLGTAVDIDVYAKRRGVLTMRLEVMGTSGGRLVVAGADTRQAVDIPGSGVVKIALRVPPGRSSVRLLGDQLTTEHEETPRAWLGSPWFTASSAEERAGALRPVWHSPDPGF